MTQPPPESRRTTTTLIAPPFTAFHPDGSLHLDLIERQAESLRANRIRGAFVCDGKEREFSVFLPSRGGGTPVARQVLA